MGKRFERPASAEAAAKLRAETGGLFLAGGTQLNMGGAPQTETLIALDALALDFIRAEAGGICLGSTITLQAIAESRELSDAGLGLLCEAAGEVANRAVRDQATLGGNLASRHSYSDMIAPLLALDAKVEMCAGKGKLEVPLKDYVDTPDSRALITSVWVAPPSAATRTARRRFARTSNDLPLVNVALALTLDGSTISSARLALGGVASTVVRVPAAETALVGSYASTDALPELVAKAIRETVQPIADLRGGVEYKTHLAVELSGQALSDCLRKEGK